MAGRRIALVLDGDTDGIAAHVSETASGLIARGDRVTIVGPAADAVLSDTGARFLNVEIPSGVHLLGDAKAVWALRSAMRGPAGGAPDVVHAFGPRAGLAALLSKSKNVPLVVSWWKDVEVDSSGAVPRVLGQADRAVARGADVCLCATSDLVPGVLRMGARDARHLESTVREPAGSGAPGIENADPVDRLDAVYRELTGY
ncbi:MAG: glycosyltransferase [Stackebrandtia sp.]